MKAALKTIFGLILSLGSLWGMAYYRGQFPVGHWSDFPSFMTGIVGMIGGLPFVITGICELANKEQKNER